MSGQGRVDTTRLWTRPSAATAVVARRGVVILPAEGPTLLGLHNKTLIYYLSFLPQIWRRRRRMFMIKNGRKR